MVGRLVDTLDTNTGYRWDCVGNGGPASVSSCTYEKKCISNWKPLFDSSSKCRGYLVIQNNGCGETRVRSGSRICGRYYCRNSSGEDIRYNGTSSDKAIKCPTDDDLTEPTDDDLTPITEDEFCELHPEVCVTTPSGDLAIDIYWSVDKIHWFDDFTKLILLKNRGEKIYIKNGITGTCTSKISPIGLFKFNLLNTSTLGGTHKYLRKIEAYIYNGAGLFATKPTSDSPTGKVFNQDLKVEYCGSAIQLDRTLNVKIADINREEI